MGHNFKKLYSIAVFNIDKKCFLSAKLVYQNHVTLKTEKSSLITAIKYILKYENRKKLLFWIVIIFHSVNVFTVFW